VAGIALAGGCAHGPAQRAASGPAKAEPPKAGTAKTRPAPATKAAPAPGAESSLERAAAAHAHYGAGVIHEMNDEPQAALQEYYQAVLLDPGNEALVLEVSQRLLRERQFDKALEVVKASAARTNASGAILARLGLVYGQLGQNDQAIAADRAAIQRAPRQLGGYRNLFVTLLQVHQNDQALAVLDEAGRQQSVDLEFLLGLAELYDNYATQVPAKKQVAQAKALDLLERIAKFNPRLPAFRLALADSFNRLGNTNRAAQLYLDLLKELPEAPELRASLHARLTEIYLRAADRHRAAEQLRAILADDPANPAAHYYLGSIAFDDKKWSEAADHFRDTMLLNPQFEQAYYDLARALINLNKPGDALGTLEEARRRFAANNEKFELEFLCGIACTREKAYSRAWDYFTRAESIALTKEPKRLNQYLYFELGAVAERKGDYATAEKHFQKSLELAPDFAEALNYLGYMWAEHDQHLEKAREYIEKALKAEPKNGAYLDSLGWVLFKLRQPQAALDYVLRASQALEEPDPIVFDHLGDIYSALQQPEKAREAWRKSLAIEPNEAIRKKLDAGASPAVSGPGANDSKRPAP
jgi:tetratricopeptide (TPR) repeat protein